MHSDATGVWWVDSVNKRIGRFAATVVTEWALPRGSGTPNEFTLARDGSVWYTSKADDRLGRFSEETGAGRPGDRCTGTPGTRAHLAPGRDRRAGQPGRDRRDRGPGRGRDRAPRARGRAGPEG